MSDPTGIISDTGEWTDQMGYWHPKGCRCEGCLDDAYVPDPHPSYWNRETDTMWEWSDETEQFVDSGRDLLTKMLHTLNPVGDQP